MLSVGLIGFPNAGKSTLFNALMGGNRAVVGSHPFTTLQPNRGQVDVPDERLEKLWQKTGLNKKTHPQLGFIDVAGLVKGAAQGEGLGNEFLGHLRQVDALLHVLRAFESEKIPHPLGHPDPKRDKEIVETELLLADAQMLERHLAKKNLSPQNQALLKKVKEAVDQGQPVRTLNFSKEEQALLLSFPFLTAKPIFYVVNLEESRLVGPYYEIDSFKALAICAKLEAELTELPWTERQQYLKESGIKHSALEAVVSASFHLLHLLTFYTLTGGAEVKAWPFPQGTTAYEAAGLIHTDLQKGFIIAEVVSFEDFLKFSSWEKVRQVGKSRLVGRDYQLADGDIIEIKFSK